MVANLTNVLAILRVETEVVFANFPLCKCLRIFGLIAQEVHNLILLYFLDLMFRKQVLIVRQSLFVGHRKFWQP
jgi:hypothetical protein